MISVEKLLLSPGLFFDEIIPDNRGLKIPMLIIFVLAVLSSISIYFVLELTTQVISEEYTSLASMIITTGVLSGFFGPFLMWVIWAVVFYAISAVLGGTGNFKQTLEVVAYGHTPQIIGSIISLIILSYYLPGIHLSPTSDPAMLEQAAAPLMNSPMMQFTSIVGLIFLLWSVNIWIFGIQKVRNLSRKNALITVGVPTGLLIIYTLFTLMVL